MELCCIDGEYLIMTVITASNVIQYSSDAEDSDASSTYALVIGKTLTMTDSYTGSWRISFQLRNDNNATLTYGKIYRNGVAYGTEHTTTSDTYTEYSEDFSSINITAGDIMEIWGKNPPGTDIIFVQDFRIKFDILGPTTSQSDMLLMF